MSALGWREIWPIRAMQAGGVLTALGMVGGQIAWGSSVAPVIVTAVVSTIMLTLIWLLARGASRRLRTSSPERIPEREVGRITVLGLMVIAIVMWLVTGYGAFVAVLWRAPGYIWYELAYLGLALCATGAMVIWRQARLEWLAHYRRDWPSDPSTSRIV